MENAKKQIKFPSSIVILFSLICFVAFLTYVVPAGQFEKVVDPATNIAKVDATSFTLTEKSPVNVFKMFIAIPQGFIDGASIIFLIVFGYFWVFSVVGTGAVSAGINKILGSKLKDSKC